MYPLEVLLHNRGQSPIQTLILRAKWGLQLRSALGVELIPRSAVSSDMFGGDTAAWRWVSASAMNH
jgi:hypothetical protein